MLASCVYASFVVPSDVCLGFIPTLTSYPKKPIPPMLRSQDAAYTLALAFENKASAFFATPSHSTIMSELTLSSVMP
jgi:hypothetical protein